MMGFSSGEYKLNNWYTYGRDDEIILTYNNGRSKKVIIDNNGRIINFPGVVEDESWIGELNEGSISPYIRYRSEFTICKDGNYMMLWQIQPDGRYWADGDGFGSNHDAEIILYSYINNEGQFLQPFRIYRIGVRQIYKEN